MHWTQTLAALAAIFFLSLTPTSALANTCQDSCGGIAPTGCSCKESCMEKGDCCDDFAWMCLTGAAGTCENSCGKSWTGLCSCEPGCEERGDCCNDYVQLCDPPEDGDGDGIPDDEDRCPDSHLDPNPNRMIGPDGCPERSFSEACPLDNRAPVHVMSNLVLQPIFIDEGGDGERRWAMRIAGVVVGQDSCPVPLRAVVEARVVDMWSAGGLTLNISEPGPVKRCEAVDHHIVACDLTHPEVQGQDWNNNVGGNEFGEVTIQLKVRLIDGAGNERSFESHVSRYPGDCWRSQMRKEGDGPIEWQNIGCAPDAAACAADHTPPVVTNISLSQPLSLQAQGVPGGQPQAGQRSRGPVDVTMAYTVRYKDLHACGAAPRVQGAFVGQSSDNELFDMGCELAGAPVAQGGGTYEAQLSCHGQPTLRVSPYTRIRLAGGFLLEDAALNTSHSERVELNGGF